MSKETGAAGLAFQIRKPHGFSAKGVCERMFAGVTMRQAFIFTLGIVA